MSFIKTSEKTKEDVYTYLLEKRSFAIKSVKYDSNYHIREFRPSSNDFYYMNSDRYRDNKLDLSVVRIEKIEDMIFRIQLLIEDDAFGKPELILL